MAYHHIALATRDMDATHAFYTEAMGFDLVKAVVAPTENAGGWAKHLFYDTGGDGLIAFWDLHDDGLPDFDPAISTGAGLPAWVNHVAFHAEPSALDDHRQRWLGQGIDCMEIDHGFCVSIYALDPNGILVEWCADSRPLDDDDRREALAVLRDLTPPLETPPVPTFHRAARPVPAG
jgi:catechol 2,3-dioxygenase-like lactoylglutathione lyase family enzyme